MTNSSKLKLKTPDEAETVFYEAFMHCDDKVMAALWADGDVVCIHPGSRAIVGHQVVVRSWTHIFHNAHPPQITYTVRNRIITDELVISLVIEEVSTDRDQAAQVLATNIYRKFENGWLMIEHHGSLVESYTQNYTIQ